MSERAASPQILLQPLREKGRYVNPLPIVRPPMPDGRILDAEPTYKDFRDWRKNRPKVPSSANVPRVDAVPDLAQAPATGIAATWVGHSSVVLQIDGLSLLCDPVWSQRLAGGFVVPRATAPGIPWSAVPKLDALLVSHNHFDHLDAPTIARIPRRTPVFCGEGVGPWFCARGFDRVTELAWWESAKLDGAAISFVPAQHFSGRTLWDRNRSLWGGFVVEGREGSVAYFAGDSGYWDGFCAIGDRFPRIDLAMIPIGAYMPRWFMAPVHVDPPEAGQAFVDLRAKAMLPIHWGTFRLADEAVDAPVPVLRAWWEEKGIDRARLHVPPLGGTVRT